MGGKSEAAKTRNLRFYSYQISIKNMSLFPPEFPFFEILVPARNAVPDIDTLMTNYPDSVLNRIQGDISQFPCVDDLADHYRQWQPQNETSAFVGHEIKDWNVMAHLRKNGCQNIPNEWCSPRKEGVKKESNAWKALQHFARDLTGTAEATMDKRFQGLVQCAGIHSSVWIKNPEVSIPYVIDQIAVLHVQLNQYRQAMIMVAIEIDGPDKWSPHADGNGDLDPKTKNVQRSEFLLRKKLALYRISSSLCADEMTARAEFLSFFQRLYMAAYLVQKNHSGMIAADLESVKEWLLVV